MSAQSDSQASTPGAAPSTEQPRVGFARFVAELREAGETGKVQWEEMLGRWRAQLAQVHLDQELDKALGKTRQTAGEAWDKLRHAPTLTQAQARGTELLRKLLARVREGAGSLEAKLAAPAEDVQAEAA